MASKPGRTIQIGLVVLKFLRLYICTLLLERLSWKIVDSHECSNLTIMHNQDIEVTTYINFGEKTHFKTLEEKTCFMMLLKLALQMNPPNLGQLH